MTAKVFMLKDKIAVVAGESKIWTKPIVATLTAAGADVAILAKQSTRLTQAVEIARRNGRKAVAIPTDITNPVQIQKNINQVIGEYGRIDILVNATDIQFFQPFMDIKDIDWLKSMDYNLNSVVNFCRAAGKQMLAQKKGRIINIVSALAERGIVNGSAFCIAESGVLQLTRVLALEWALAGITVNAVGTGWFEEAGKPADELISKYIPAKRYGKPEEIGGLIVYLAADATEFTTGQFMYVDGGLMSHA